MKPLSTLMVRIMRCYLLFEFDSDTCSKSCVVSYTHYCAQRFTACNITGPTWPMFMSLIAHNMNYISQYKFNHYTPRTRKLWGVYWFHSVRLSVHLSVRLAFRDRSVAPTVLVGSISYLYILSSNLRRCVMCTVSCKIAKFQFLAIFLKFVTLTLSSFDLGSDVNH